MTCLNCGSPKVKAKGRCTACYEFQRRNHRDRTSAEVAAANLRKFEREHGPGWQAWRVVMV